MRRVDTRIVSPMSLISKQRFPNSWKNMLALKVNGPVERGRFDEPEIAGRDTAVAPVSHYFAGLRWEWFIPRRRVGALFWTLSIFEFCFWSCVRNVLACGLCVFFFFSLIYREKFKGDRTGVGLFIYLIYTLLRMYFLRSYSWKYLFSYSFLIRGGYEDRKIFRFWLENQNTKCGIRNYGSLCSSID